jgi:hypothetical protein
MKCSNCDNEITIGSWPFCPHGKPTLWDDPNVHPSERVVYYEGPCGEISIPSRADKPMHPKMAAVGYVRRECETISQIRDLERRQGLRHERSYFDQNSAAADRSYSQ